MFYNHINVQIIIKFSDRVVRGELYVISPPQPKLLAIYLVLSQSALPLASSIATTAHIDYINYVFSKMLMTEETQVTF